MSLRRYRVDPGAASLQGAEDFSDEALKEVGNLFFRYSLHPLLDLKLFLLLP